MVPIWFFSCASGKKNKYPVGFIGSCTFLKQMIVNYFYDSHRYIKKNLYSSHKFIVDLGYKIISFEVKEKVWKKYCSSQSWQNEDKNIFSSFFKYSLNKRDGADIFEIDEVRISNFVKFRLESMSSKIKRAFKKRTTFSIKIWPKRTLIRHLKGTINQCNVKFLTWGGIYF